MDKGKICMAKISVLSPGEYPNNLVLRLSFQHQNSAEPQLISTPKLDMSEEGKESQTQTPAESAENRAKKEKGFIDRPPETKPASLDSTTKDSETENSKPGSLTSLKIRKRPLDTANQTGSFSRREKPAITSRRDLPPPLSKPHTSSQQPPWAANSQSPIAKPSWLSDADLSKLQTKEPAQESEEPRLKRPTRRDDVHDQLRYAQDARQIADRRSEQEQELDRQIRREIELKQQNLNSVVRQHYNQRAFASKRERRQLSPIIKLRNYHNAIKYMLINNNTQPGQRALDMGCGKGGDIDKWVMAQVSEYIGIDISNASIVEAVKRYKSRRRANFEVTFITGDCFSQPLPNVLYDFPHITFPVNVVSMQFCMHYAFETEAKARQMLENVARSLGPGGMFIGTIPSSDFIREKVKNMPPGTKSFGNSIYSVTFLNDLPPNGIFTQTYGNIYNYYLKDAIDNVPEYVVPFEAFRALAQEYGLFLKFKKPFAEMFQEEMPTWYNKLSPRIIEGMKRSDGKVGLEGDEKEASAFYCAFAFVKTD